MITEKTVTTYTTSDGQVFSHYRDAMVHEKNLVDISDLEWYAFDSYFEQIPDPLTEEGLRSMTWFVYKTTDLERLATAFRTFGEIYSLYTPFDEEYSNYEDALTLAVAGEKWIVFYMNDEWEIYDLRTMEKLCRACNFTGFGETEPGKPFTFLKKGL